MNKLYLVPLEKVKGRYTEQWYNNFPKHFSNAGFDVEIIDGEQYTDFVDVGTFLDIHTTIHYKNSQIQKIAKLFADKQIKENDIFFFMDYEFWGGVESVRLLAQMNQISVKIFAFAHAASYTIGDAFSVAHKHQKYIEVGWLAACDKIFVGSQHHKNAIIKRRLELLATSEDLDELKDKIVVTGNPFFEEDYISFNTIKKNQVILPNRFDIEKRPDLALSIAYNFKQKYPDTEFVITTSHPKFKSNQKWLYNLAKNYEQAGIVTIKENLSKDEYHKILSESKVMLSTNDVDENFGICIFEAMYYGTYPLLKNDLSHPELVNNTNEFLYDNEDEIEDKLSKLLFCNMSHTAEILSNQTGLYFRSIDKIINEIINEIIN